MRILVTGAAGYIGSALVRGLAAAGKQVLATDQSAPADAIGNIACPQFARSLITPDIGVVFHLAALVSGGAEQNFELGTQVNLDATRDLLEACRLAGHRPKFIFASSIAVYGGVGEIDDETPAAPRLSYRGVGLVSAQEMWDAVRRRARGKVRFEPDPALQAIMDSAPKASFSKRACELGFRPSANIEEIVREYEEAAVAHHG